MELVNSVHSLYAEWECTTGMLWKPDTSDTDRLPQDLVLWKTILSIEIQRLTNG